MNSNENKRPTSLLIPKTSPFANTKFRFAMTAIIVPEMIAPKAPKMPTSPPSKNAKVVMIAVERKYFDGVVSLMK